MRRLREADAMTDDLSTRITLRIGAQELKEIEALAALRGVSTSCCIRSMLNHFLADDGGKASELARIRKIFSGVHRARRA